MADRPAALQDTVLTFYRQGPLGNHFVVVVFKNHVCELLEVVHLQYVPLSLSGF